MPIIDRTSTLTKVSKAPGIIDGETAVEEEPKPEADGVDVQDLDDSVEAESTDPKTYFSAFITLVVGMFIAIGGYTLYSAMERNPEIDPSEIELSISSVRKLGELEALTKREFDANFVSLEAARASDSETTRAALEIIVDNNRNDLLRYKQEYSAAVLELFQLYNLNPVQTEAALLSAIELADRKQSSVTSSTLNSVLQIMQSSSSQTNKESYIQAQLESRI